MKNQDTLRNKEIIIIGLQPWYTEIGSNCKNLAIELAKSNKVLYINTPLNRNTLRKENADPHINFHHQVIRGKQDPLKEIGPNFWNYYPKRIHESINWIPGTRLFSTLCKVNDKRLAKDMQEAADRIGFSNYIIFNDNDIFRGVHLKKLLNPLLYIYYCRDFLTSSGYYKKHGRVLEPKHIARADLALSNSIYLTQYLKKFNAHSHFVGQGCDINLFNAAIRHPYPDDIKKSEKPVIGYVGTITTRRLDMEILLSIAKERPDWDLVLVGPEDDQFMKSELHHLPNVTFTGKKSLKELPTYIQAFDVCLNPQVINQLTIGNYPLKIDEYLAMGKPVVATHTEAMKMFSDFCYLANKPKDYVNHISKALAEDSPKLQEERIHFARQHTWENSVNEIYKHIKNTLPGYDKDDLLSMQDMESGIIQKV